MRIKGLKDFFLTPAILDLAIACRLLIFVLIGTSYPTLTVFDETDYKKPTVFRTCPPLNV